MHIMTFHICASQLAVTRLMASFSPLTNFSTAPSPYSKTGFFHNPFITLRSSNALLRLSPLKVSADNEVATSASAFEEPRWIGGTWDLKQFQINGNTDWDAVIDAGQVMNYQYFGYTLHNNVFLVVKCYKFNLTFIEI